MRYMTARRRNRGACAEHNAGDEAARLILSDRSADEVAAMLRRRAIGESWAKATAKATGAY